jgi:hypothetical protein
MNFEVTTTVEMPEEIEFFPLFSLESVSGGTKFTVKSPVFAEWVKKNQGKNPLLLDKKWAALGDLYRTNIRLFPYDVGMGLFIGTGEDDSSTPNLLWLFHPKLGEGFDFTYPEPLSLNNLEDLFHSTCEELRDIYVDHIRGVKLSAKLKEKKVKAPRAPEAGNGSF